MSSRWKTLFEKSSTSHLGKVFEDNERDFGQADTVDTVDTVPVLLTERYNPEDPGQWQAGVASLQLMPPPTGFSAARWLRVQFDAAELLESWGTKLRTLGWSSLDVFGVHPRAPGPRVDCYGLALLLKGGRVLALTEQTAGIEHRSGSHAVCRRKPMPEAVPVWELGLRVDDARRT